MTITSNKPVGNEQLKQEPPERIWVRFWKNGWTHPSVTSTTVPVETDTEYIRASAPVQGDVISRAEADRKLNDLTEWFCYWLLRAYQSGHREGWEPSPSTSETMSDLLNVLANAGFDPSSEQAKELLKQRFAVFYTLPATSIQPTPDAQYVAELNSARPVFPEPEDKQ